MLPDSALFVYQLKEGFGIECLSVVAIIINKYIIDTTDIWKHV